MRVSRRGARGEGVDVSVVTSAHDLADARLHRECAALRRAGLRVEVIGLGDPDRAPTEVSVVPVTRRAGKVARARSALTLPFRAAGRVILTLDPDLVPAATIRRRLQGGALVVDVHEDYLALLADRAWARGPMGLAARTVARTATALARRCDLAVVADDHLPPERARRRLVVRNLPDPAYIPPPGEPDPNPRAVYIGDVRTSRGLRLMLDALTEAPEWTLDVIGPLSVADRAWLEGWLARSPAGGRVRLHGRLPPGPAWQVAKGAWAGLALLSDTPAFRRAVPTKLYEYLAAGLAVISTPLPRMAAIVGESEAGVVVRDAAEAAAALRAWAKDPDLLRFHRRNALSWAAANLPGTTPYDELAQRIRALADGQPAS